jgi:hypothetical protein
MPYDIIDLFLPGQVVQRLHPALTEPMMGIPYTSPNSDGKYSAHTIQSYADLNSESNGPEWSVHNPNGTSFAESIGRYFGHTKDLQTSRSRYQSSNKAPRQPGPHSCVAFVPNLLELLTEDSRQNQYIKGRGDKPTEIDAYRCGETFWVKPHAPYTKEIEYIAAGKRILILIWPKVPI